MQDAAYAFSSSFDRPVLDQPASKGTMTLRLNSNGPPRHTARLPRPLPNASALATALKDVGLTFTATKAPVEILVIDRVEKPSEN